MANPLAAVARALASWQPTLTYFLMFIAIGMISGILGPSLIHLAEQTGSSMSQIAILFTARALGIMTGSVVSGRLLDRFDGHRVILLMLLLATLGMALMPFSPLLLMMGVIFLLGYAEVSANVGGNLMLMRCHQERSGPYISALHFSFGVGAMTVPLLVVWSLKLTDSVLLSFWLVALLTLLVALLLWPQKSPPEPEQRNGQVQGTAIDRLLFALLLVLFSLYVGMEMTFAGWVATYGVLGGSSTADAAVLVSLFWLSLSVGRLLAIPLLRTGRYYRILFACLVLALLMLICLMADLLPLTAITLLFGLSLSALFPTLFTLSHQLITLNGKRTGLIFLACGLGAMLAPSLTGPLIDTWGGAALPQLLFGMLLAMLAGMLLLIRRDRSTRSGSDA